MGAAALGVGAWYLWSSIGGGAVSYMSLDSFLAAIGACKGGACDIASANGCWLCGYIEKLFGVIGTAAESFWFVMLDSLWVLLGIGFGIFLFYETGKYLYEASKKNATLDESEKKLELKAWFDKVWKQAVRVMIVAALLGGLGLGGKPALKEIANVTITPVMFVGSQLSMAATGISDSAQCSLGTSDDILNPVLKPFMCVMGNLNTITLAGAAGGFALMNYSWMDMGGGIMTWLAGLALLIMFLIIGFDLFFKVLNVIFRLVFFIVFLPLIIAAAAFEGTWKLADGVTSRSITMLATSAIRIVSITLKIVILYATVSYAADEYFPGPNDGFNAFLPSGVIDTERTNPDEKTMSVMAVFSTCEKVATVSGEMDKEKFKNCFVAQKAATERKYPGAFDFMKNGFEFLMLMFGLFFLYYYALSPKIDNLLKTGKEDEGFNFGTWIKDFGKAAYKAPGQIAEKITGAMKKGT